jgi:hypothetical protein
MSGDIAAANISPCLSCPVPNRLGSPIVPLAASLRSLAGEQNYFVLGRHIHRSDRPSVVERYGPSPYMTRGHLELA